jgi:hypothetical protein
VISTGSATRGEDLLVYGFVVKGDQEEVQGRSGGEDGFFGLFMSRAEHGGKGLEEFVAPVSRRFLIPIFFVTLGSLLLLRAPRRRPTARW